MEGKIAHILTITVEREERLASGSALVTTLGLDIAFQVQLPPAISLQYHSYELERIGKGKRREPEAARL